MLEYFSKLKKPKAETVEKPAAGPGAEDLQDPKAKQSREDAQHDRDLFDHEAAQRASSSNPLHATPVLAPEDESFLENILNSDYGPAPPLPPRIVDWSPDTDTETDSVSAKSVGKEVKESKKKGDNKDNEEEGKEEKKAEKKPNRFSQFFSKKKASDGLKPETDVPPKEAEREKKDLGRVLDRLNLSAKNNKVVSLSNESSDLLRRFNQVFKDLVNGVPTAYDDLTALIEDRDGTIAKGFDKLPSSLKKLVTQLPDKITKSLAPEILLAAAEAQGLKTASGGGAKGAAKKLFMPQNIVELATKPGALVGMLRAIVEALKTRWPAFMGMNVLWSVALSCESSTSELL